MSTIGSIAESVALKLGEEYGDFDVKEAFESWVIEAIDEVLLEASWPFGHLVKSITTVQGSAAYSIDIDAGDIRTLYRTDTDLPLTFTNIDELRQSSWDHDEQGPPTHWYFAGGSAGKLTVNLYPVPDAEYLIYAYGDVQATEYAGTTTFPFPKSVEPVIKAHVRASYHHSAGDYNGGDREAMKYSYLLSKLKARFLTQKANHRAFRYSDVPAGMIWVGPQLPRTITE